MSFKVECENTSVQMKRSFIIIIKCVCEYVASTIDPLAELAHRTNHHIFNCAKKNDGDGAKMKFMRRSRVQKEMKKKAKSESERGDGGEAIAISNETWKAESTKKRFGSMQCFSCDATLRKIYEVINKIDNMCACVCVCVRVTKLITIVIIADPLGMCC